jgi:hypothetical protein
VRVRLLPSLSAGRPPIDMLITSTFACFSAKIIPSINPEEVHAFPKTHTRTETI